MPELDRAATLRPLRKATTMMLCVLGVAAETADGVRVAMLRIVVSLLS